MRIEALIFDVDGTLADTEEVHRVAFNRAFAEFGLDWNWTPELYHRLLAIAGGKERLRLWIDERVSDPGEAARLRLLVPEIHRAKTLAYRWLVRQGALQMRPGVVRLMREARRDGRKLAIATTTTLANVDELLASTLGGEADDWFEVIAGADAVKAKKPAPDIYLLALDAMGLAPEQCIAFEDSAKGLQAARAAGIATVVTPTRWSDGEDLSEATWLLPHLGDPDQPLPAEQRGALEGAGWLTLEALDRMHAGVLAA